MLLYYILSFLGGNRLNNIKIVGILTKKTIQILELSILEGTKILCGDSNILHMKESHPEDFEKYGDKLVEIIKYPTYVCKHPDKKSIEFVKIFIDDNNAHVLVAVRTTGTNTLFARTLFVMSDEKVRKYYYKNAFKPY